MNWAYSLHLLSLWVAGIIIGGQHLSYDQMGTPNHKPTTRLRWSPSQIQLQILERLFEQGNGTPNRQHIKEITDELRQHGQIGETNVYNWFQNRKARAKRRHQQVGQRCRTCLNQAKDGLQVTQWNFPMSSFLPSRNSLIFNFMPTFGTLPRVQTPNMMFLLPCYSIWGVCC
jgi:hypothetical protein